MWSAIASVFLGVIGWLATSFFAKPLVDFLNLRSQVLEEMIFTANVDGLSDPVHLQNCRRSLRRLGTKVLATDVAAPWLLRKFLARYGYDLHAAGSSLIGLSNALSVQGLRHLDADKVETGLQLPRTSTAEFLEGIKEQIHKGHA
jgi:hypothetical protein